MNKLITFTFIILIFTKIQSQSPPPPPDDFDDLDPDSWNNDEGLKPKDLLQLVTLSAFDPEQLQEIFGKINYQINRDVLIGIIHFQLDLISHKDEAGISEMKPEQLMDKIIKKIFRDNPKSDGNPIEGLQDLLNEMRDQKYTQASQFRQQQTPQDLQRISTEIVEFFMKKFRQDSDYQKNRRLVKALQGIQKVYEDEDMKGFSNILDNSQQSEDFQDSIQQINKIVQKYENDPEFQKQVNNELKQSKDIPDLIKRLERLLDTDKISQIFQSDIQKAQAMMDQLKKQRQKIMENNSPLNKFLNNDQKESQEQNQDKGPGVFLIIVGVFIAIILALVGYRCYKRKKLANDPEGRSLTNYSTGQL